jgi:hypothetical protein
MRKFLVVVLTALIALISVAFVTKEDTVDVKCLVQLKNYTGEGAYLIVSLLDENGKYVQTLHVQGKDSEWYNEITEWWGFYGKYRPDIDAISGETIAGGERKVTILKIPSSAFAKAQTLRFETAVEDQEYYTSDIEIKLDPSQELEKKYDGSGWIRYIRMMPQ